MGMLLVLVLAVGCSKRKATASSNTGSNGTATSHASTTGSSSGGSGGGAAMSTLPGDPALEQYLSENFDFLSRFGAFYVAGQNQASMVPTPSGASGREVFDAAVRLFSSFLDQNEDGAFDNLDLVQSLGKHLAFTIGHTSTLPALESAISSQFNRYAMSMFSDVWPFVPEYTGKNIQLSGLRSSLWRPDSFNALWEETFHTVTEGYNRFEPSWSFQKGSPLSTSMKADIDDGMYDIQEQNQLEGGHYDWQTAVNEYVHQIWVIHNAGKADVLTPPQASVVSHMSTSTAFPMTVNANYSGTLAVSIK
jgi:hypothetical protein